MVKSILSFWFVFLMFLSLGTAFPGTLLFDGYDSISIKDGSPESVEASGKLAAYWSRLKAGK